MVSENLLATYSLLAYIKDQEGDDKGKSLLGFFIPILKQTINWMLRENNLKPLCGKDYTEIKSGVKKYFDLDMPIEVIGAIMKKIYDEEHLFTLNKDHSYIIKQGFALSLTKEYDNQKNKISKLENHYKIFCKRQNVKYDFQELVNFIQDQKNRVFDGNDTVVGKQEYYVSKYVNECIRRKDFYYNVICSIYLGGIISSYYKFQINEKVVDTELLWDTNFYISLCKLNTQEAFETCSQLLNLATAMGFRFSILQKTIEQIKILITNKAKEYDNKDYISSWDESDILAACSRENISKSELLLVKDGLLDDLSHKGVNIIYDANIKDIIDAAEKSNDLKMLSKIRGSKESALNDIIAQLYVEKKRKNKQIAEFNDVNCWFLNNSFSVNKTELHLPVWQRISICAPDLLLLLWFSNPSLAGKKVDSLLAISSLSANVFKYRSEKMPSSKVIEEIQNKVAKLQLSNQISQKAIAKLCIRMSEGCIEENEAERIIMMSTDEFVEYLDQIRDAGDAYMEVSEENEELRDQNVNLKKDLITEKVKNKINNLRLGAVLYCVGAIGLYLIYWFFIHNTMESLFVDFVIQLLYWIITCVLANYINHKSIWFGLKSFFKRAEIEEIVQRSILDDQLM